MNLKKAINKKGSYILESVISLPIFMIAVIVMSSVILMYACIEDANFIAATELRRTAAEALAADSSALLPSRIDSRLRQHSQVVSDVMEEYGYRASYSGQDELIFIKTKIRMETSDPLDLASEAEYRLAAVTRAYVGRERKLNRMTEADMMNADAEAVYIFPKRGERYHSRSCTFLKAASESAALSNAIRSEYSPCPVCHSRNAVEGTRIWFFPKDGESYHLSSCPTLQRNYVEIERSVARERGYTPCSKCGG